MSEGNTTEGGSKRLNRRGNVWGFLDFPYVFVRLWTMQQNRRRDKPERREWESDVKQH